MSRKNATRMAATGARMVAGVIVIAGLAAGGVSALHVPWPEVVREPAAQWVTPAVGDTQLTCSGPFRAIGRNATDPSQMTVAAKPATTAAAVDAELESVDLATPGVSGSDVWTMFRTTSDGRTVVPAAASESVTISAADLAGFAAGACAAPALESWIVGGSAGTGTSDILLLANPGSVTATVSMTVYGGDGAVSMPSVVVPAESQLSLPLAAGAAGELAPVVQVVATGAPIQASLQSSLIRTLDPSGIDVQNATGVPQYQSTLLGVRVLTEPLNNSPNVNVRVLVPTTPDESRPEGDAAEATVPVRVTVRHAADGTPAGAPIDFAVERGVPSEVGLPQLAPGYYSIDVDAAEPAVTAAWQATTQARGMDFAWMTPAPMITQGTAFSVPAGPDPRLHVRNASGEVADVRLAGADGSSVRSMSLQPGESVLVTLNDRTVYTLDSDSPLQAAVTMSARAAIAGWPVAPLSSSPEPVRVYY